MSHFTVAGIYPSFFSIIGSTQDYLYLKKKKYFVLINKLYFLITLSILTLGNFNKGVESLNHSFGFSNFIVGIAPSPLKSNINLCVLGFYSPFSTIASNIPLYYAIIVGLKNIFT